MITLIISAFKQKKRSVSFQMAAMATVPRVEDHLIPRIENSCYILILSDDVAEVCLNQVAKRLRFNKEINKANRLVATTKNSHYIPPDVVAVCLNCVSTRSQCHTPKTITILRRGNRLQVQVWRLIRNYTEGTVINLIIIVFIKIILVFMLHSACADHCLEMYLCLKQLLCSQICSH